MRAILFSELDLIEIRQISRVDLHPSERHYLQKRLYFHKH